MLREKGGPSLGNNNSKIMRHNLLMIQESRVLLGIEHLEQRTRRVAIVPFTDFVHLVDKNKRVFGANSLERLDDFARQGTETFDQ